jgi:hypothetical protein
MQLPHKLATVGSIVFASYLCATKFQRSFVALVSRRLLNRLAAAIIAFRKVPLKINTIYG